MLEKEHERTWRNRRRIAIAAMMSLAVLSPFAMIHAGQSAPAIGAPAQTSAKIGTATGSLDPPSIPVEQIIQKFAAREAEFKAEEAGSYFINAQATRLVKKMKDGKLPVTKISAAIFCERTGQKAILIGKQGEMLKRIGTAAQKDIESLLGTRVFLELFVKVQEEWRSSRGFVEDLDWRRQLDPAARRDSQPI